jgi:hypothetical protein
MRNGECLVSGKITFRCSMQNVVSKGDVLNGINTSICQTLGREPVAQTCSLNGMCSL